jgi:RNA polymerase sigma-70 factor (ECF subfamily)
MLLENANPERTLACRSAHSGFATPVPKLGSDQTAALDHTSLVRAAQQGDVSAFEELVRTYDQPVLRLALRLSRSESDAQDIYQDAFLRAYQSLPAFRFECSFYTWIHRITTNVCLDYLRRRQKLQKHVTMVSSPDGEQSEVVSYLPDHDPASDPDRSLRTRELRACIVRALAGLSPRERMVFELKHYHNLKLRTVAEMLNTSEGTIKNTLFRATHKLRLALTEMR